MTQSKDLTALVGSRICHDLANPLSAIGNGVELLSMMGTTGGEEMALITSAVENATARINFFRVAYGAASEDQMMSRSQIVQILDTISAGGRLEYRWDLPEDLSRPELRVAFLVLQCLEAAMPRGGTIAVSDRWVIEAVADDLRPDPALWDALPDRPEAALTAAQVQFGLLADALAETGRTLSVTQAPGNIRVSF